MTGFSDKLRTVIIFYKRIGYNLNAIRQSACLLINPITIDNLLHSLIARRDRASVMESRANKVDTKNIIINYFITK